MALLVGVLVGLGVGLLTTSTGLDRDRALYPFVTIVVAAYYLLFAAMGGNTQVLVIETLVGLVFVALAVWGFKSSLWIVAAALLGHGLFDVVHGAVITNPGMPAWWPPFCAAADFALAAWLAWLLRSGRSPSRPAPATP
jgi:hypothetical protein